MNDKKLQELLHQFAMEETAADFTQNIMQRIEAPAPIKNREIPFLKTKLIQAVVAIFVLVFVALLVVCIGSQPVVFPFHFMLQLPPNYITQLTSFLLVFWVVLLTNQFYQRKQKYAM